MHQNMKIRTKNRDFCDEEMSRKTQMLLHLGGHLGFKDLTYIGHQTADILHKN